MTVSGSVSSYFLKQMAQEIVLKVAGVEAVENQVEVR
jgi:osmotically-inducible protein OsmY